jgi:hypothetical protein
VFKLIESSMRNRETPMAKMLTLAWVAGVLLALSSCSSVKSSSSAPVTTNEPSPTVEAVSWWHLPSTSFIP